MSEKIQRTPGDDRASLRQLDAASDPALLREPVAPLRAEDLARKTVETVSKEPYWNTYVPAGRMCPATYRPVTDDTERASLLELDAAAEVAGRAVQDADQQVTADNERARLRELRERMLLVAARGALTGSRVVEVARQWVKFVEEG